MGRKPVLYAGALVAVSVRGDDGILHDVTGDRAHEGTKGGRFHHVAGVVWIEAQCLSTVLASYKELTNWTKTPKTATFI